MHRHSPRKGFSLLELMAVIALIGVVAAVTLYRLNSIDRKAACETVMKQNINLVQTAIERYRYDRNRFPAELQDLVSEGLIPNIPTETDYFRYTYDAQIGIASYTVK